MGTISKLEYVQVKRELGEEFSRRLCSKAGWTHTCDSTTANPEKRRRRNSERWLPSGADSRARFRLTSHVPVAYALHLESKFESRAVGRMEVLARTMATSRGLPRLPLCPSPRRVALDAEGCRARSIG
jgi:hypothetical protein